jgi:CPA2 family monovalent cation:H+ antiporter-2
MDWQRALMTAAGGHGGIDLLAELALILCAAAVTTVLFQRIKQPVVLGYLLAGVLVGPHTPVPLFADTTMAQMVSEMGVILLMFSLGLEFSLRKLMRIGPTAGVVGIIECSLMISLGYMVGRLFGWTAYESVFAGALVAISSTTIVVKAFSEQGVSGKLTEIVYGILIAEDLIAVLLLAILTAVASGAGLSTGALMMTVARLAAFLAVLLAVGMLVVPRLVRLVVSLGRKETLVVASVGICFGFALLARRFGYSVALGAFLGGALVAESGAARQIEKLIEPVRDVFAAVFFVSVGMLIDPHLIAQHWLAVLVLTGVVVTGKVTGVAFGSFIAGNGVRTSIQAGMSLAQIGEFSFIIAGLGLSLKATGAFLYPVAVAVSAVTTLLTPWLMRASGRAASYVDSRLPHALQTYAALYGSWVQNLGSAPRRPTTWSRIRRMAGLLLLDVVLIGVIVIGVSLNTHRLVRMAAEAVALEPHLGRALVVAATGALLVPFLLGAVRTARALGLALAVEALPSTAAGLDLAAAPRRALLVTLQLAILLVAGIPLVAATQPFVPSSAGVVVLAIGVLALALPFWRSATNLQGHVRAGAQVLVEALATQGQRAPTAPTMDVNTLLPGLGITGTVQLAEGDAPVGKTLKQLNLRGLTGASVIAIERGGGALVPTGDELLQPGDTLVVIGTKDAVSSARDLLTPASPAA